ncbi:MAG: tetratricopeptide repeat protein [Planctomycetota bacterium]
MDEQKAAANRLLHLARPFLDRNDPDSLSEQLQLHWSPECLKLLLDEKEERVVETAATCLGLIGDMSAANALAYLLHHDSPTVIEAAENALWHLFFRDGGPLGQAVLYRISESIKSQQCENATALLTELIRVHPTFAEAYHQRSCAYYFNNEYTSALRDARRACELNPLHFAAWTMVAHAHSAMGRFTEALSAYREALRIHPNLAGVRATMHEVREKLAPTLVS